MLSLLKDREEQIQRALGELGQITQAEKLEEWRLKFLGKRGWLAGLFQQMGALPAAERPEWGRRVYACQETLQSAFLSRQKQIEDQVLTERLNQERLDPSTPAAVPYRGSLHLLTQVTERVVDIFRSLDFQLAVGPEVETDFYNFEAMNIPPDHPARAMQDTFFLSSPFLLRTHTSPVQMRSMQSQDWPLRLIVPGTVYRRDDLDATHTPQFHQIEGLWVDEGVQMSHLKGVLEYFVHRLLGEKTQIRFRPSYFPFVEPGAEVDVSCFVCSPTKRKACPVCKETGWLELLGAGMVHPHLFRVAGYASQKTVPTGFAFGMGVERLAMLLGRIPDIRILYQGDVRFLKQY